MVTAEELRAALAECRRTCTGELPCTAPEYLEARRKYRELMERAGQENRTIRTGYR